MLNEKEKELLRNLFKKKTKKEKASYYDTQECERERLRRIEDRNQKMIDDYDNRCE